MAKKNRYGGKKGHRKNPKRVAAGKKAARTRKRNAGKGKISRKGGRAMGVAYCSIGSCARRPIFGGAKGLVTHQRRKHGRR